MSFAPRFLSSCVAIVALLTVSAGTVRSQESVPLIPAKDPAAAWRFNNGQEFAGATGGLTVDPAAKREGLDSLKLTGDFTKGGRYVEAGRKIDNVEIGELAMWVRSSGGDRFTLRLSDATGQTHQIAMKLEPTTDWQRVSLPIERFFARRGQADAVPNIAKYESWGGAKDGKWHGPAKAVYILLSPSGEMKTRTMWLNGLVIVPPASAPAGFKSDFTDKLSKGWEVTEGVSLEAKSAANPRAALLLARPLEKVERPISATGPAFAVAPGQWSLSAACKVDLESPDSSYDAVVSLDCLDASGKMVERLTVADLYGKRAWQPVKKVAAIPRGAVSARFHVQLNKAWGEFRVSDLAASFVAPPKKDDRIARVLFSTAQLGNLLFPEDPRQFTVSVEARQALPENQRMLSYEVRDYWGSEHTKLATVPLGAPEKKGGLLIYPGSIDLAAAPLEVGRYYEVHVSVPQGDGEPFATSTSFAILPEAVTKRYKPEEIPFTSRNWDNRITEFIKLTDRLGVRICGLWGNWSSKPPYKAEAPGLDLVKQLGMGWLTTTPCKYIEAGKRDYDETALRQGVRNLIENFGHVRPMIINLGNEPHGKGERVRANVEAYRIVYEEVKKIDPTIPVVATSVEPNEEYFQLGYGKWCDAYDFHVYETPEGVRANIAKYRELMKKYGPERPIWSTELGLNSQGQTRLVVAREVTRKFAAFFAAGGANVSWFGLLYPDPEGKSFGSSGDSHNVFDSRFKRYAPRLDAIAYYNGVNGIAAKKFVQEKTYADDISAFLFRDRDDRTLQVLWKKKGRQDVSVPLTGVKEVQVIRVDGRRRALNAGGKALTLTITEDPLLLIYDGGEKTLPETLGAPLATFKAPPASIPARGDMTLAVANDGAVTVELLAPPFWTVKKSAPASGGKSVEFVVTPAAGSVREADFTVTLSDAAGLRSGELYLRPPVAK